MFTSGFGFVVDYLAEILHNLRDVDYSDRFEKYFELSPTLSTRDKDGIRKTFSGLMKLIYPDGRARAEQMEPLLRCAIEGRKRVKDQLCRIDSTMEEVEFTYKRVGAPDSDSVAVPTLEELDYPQFYWRGRVMEDEDAVGLGVETAVDANAGASAGDVFGASDTSGTVSVSNAEGVAPSVSEDAVKSAQSQESVPKTRIERLAERADGKRKELRENQRGVSYFELFGPYLAGAKNIVVKDAYVRIPYQLRNFAEFLETVLSCKDSSDEVQVHLVTGRNDPMYVQSQIDGLEQLKSIFAQLGIDFTFEFSDTLHDRSITTDTGWLILPGRGLDIFQKFDDGNWLNPMLRNQKLRRVKECNVTYQQTEG